MKYHLDLPPRCINILIKRNTVLRLLGLASTGDGINKKAVYMSDRESLKIERENPVSILPGRGLFSGTENLNIDFVFPVLHGVSGEDGTIQGTLEIAEIPYAGSGILGSAAGMDKSISKQLWQQKGFPVVPFKEITSYTDRNITEAVNSFGFPLFVKPARAGSSVGVKRAENKQELIAHIKYAFQLDTKLLIEPAVTGREIECSVIGNESPESFYPGEILLAEGFYDYKSKYIDAQKHELLFRLILRKMKVNT